MTGNEKVAAHKPEKARMPSISFIVARSYPGKVIGYKNALPWHLGTDLRRFREITRNHVVVMGNNTFLSIGKPLPKRTNVVLTRAFVSTNFSDIGVDSDTQLIYSKSFEEALFVADIISICKGGDDIFIIGGQHMYELFGQFVNKVYLTEVSAEVQGDAFFNMEFKPKEWKTISEIAVTKSEGIDDFNYMFSVLVRRDRKNRYKFVREFFTELETKRVWIQDNLNKHKTEIIKYIDKNLEMEF